MEVQVGGNGPMTNGKGCSKKARKPCCAFGMAYHRLYGADVHDLFIFEI